MKRSEIAKEVEVHRSTITRELKRNADDGRGYHPGSATKMTRERHKEKRKRCIDGQIWAKVEEFVRRQWSLSLIHI